jgi:hypothetical protein
MERPIGLGGFPKRVWLSFPNWQPPSIPLSWPGVNRYAIHPTKNGTPESPGSGCSRMRMLSRGSDLVKEVSP